MTAGLTKATCSLPRKKPTPPSSHLARPQPHNKRPPPPPVKFNLAFAHIFLFFTFFWSFLLIVTKSATHFQHNGIEWASHVVPAITCCCLASVGLAGACLESSDLLTSGIAGTLLAAFYFFTLFMSTTTKAVEKGVTRDQCLDASYFHWNKAFCYTMTGVDLFFCAFLTILLIIGTRLVGKLWAATKEKERSVRRIPPKYSARQNSRYPSTMDQSISLSEDAFDALGIAVDLEKPLSMSVQVDKMTDSIQKIQNKKRGEEEKESERKKGESQQRMTSGTQQTSLATEDEDEASDHELRLKIWNSESETSTSTEVGSQHSESYTPVPYSITPRPHI